MPDYPMIADHGIVGDLQTAALIASDGTVDWWCTPRFDSPSVFASLLDSERGGHCRLAADLDGLPEATIRQLYLPETAILVTRFMAPGGVGEVVDFMEPDTSPTPSSRHRLIRGLRVVRGSLPFELVCRPRFDYGRAQHTLSLDGSGTAVFSGPDTQLHVQATEPIALRADGQDVTARFTLEAGQTAAIVLTSDVSGQRPEPLPPIATLVGALDACNDFWHAWLRHSSYRGRWHDAVHRSAITLKLLTYHPSGAPIAAATMGLPEQIGGERNWDYRFTWVRDGSLSVGALIELGFVEEALAFRHWLRDRLEAEPTESGEPLQIMYRIDGSPHLTEEVLEHLEGYRKSAPVRAGNAAADQIQLDIYGEAAYALAEAGDVGGIRGWRAFADLLDWLAENWDRPDEGIWETRGGSQDFTYSRLMTWVAFDRGIRAAPHSRARPTWRAGLPRGTPFSTRSATRLEREAQGLRAALRDRCAGRLPAADAEGRLHLPARPRLALHPGRHGRRTRQRQPRLPLRPGGVARTGCAAPRARSTCAASSTWRRSPAPAGCGRPATPSRRCSPTPTTSGCSPRRSAPSGEQLGNFPQAFTHLALVTAALALDEELDRAEAARRGGTNDQRVQRDGPDRLPGRGVPRRPCDRRGAPQLVDLVDRGIIRILDLAFVRRQDDGALTGLRPRRRDQRRRLRPGRIRRAPPPACCARRTGGGRRGLRTPATSPES